jgi:hypothetical protein
MGEFVQAVMEPRIQKNRLFYHFSVYLSFKNTIQLWFRYENYKLKASNIMGMIVQIFI